MCGIFGLISNNPIDKNTVEKATKIMAHRGPDDYGIYSNSLPSTLCSTHFHVGLGHTRLSIIDLSSAGHQPMCNEDGTIWIVHNGEIYNFRELRSTLENRGHDFRSHTDTEVILHAYEEWGIDCLHKFNGMFAFGLWDEKKQIMVIARDRLGIKPLYYTQFNDKFVFGSEVKAILQVDGVKREIDVDGLHSILLLLWVPAEKTIFKNINKLLPGHYLVYKNGTTRTFKYWDIPLSEQNATGNEWVRLYEMIDESVKNQMVSDVPLGAFLSGGLDSSAIVSLMKKHAEHKIATYTIAFSGKDRKFEAMPDDSKYAKLMADYLDTDHHEFTVSPDIVALLPKIIWHLDEPIADPAAINTYLICKAAKERGTTVLLGGIGGDELFGGYRKYMSARFANYYRLLPSDLRHSLQKSVFENLRVSSQTEGFKYFRWLKWFTKKSSDDQEMSYVSNSSYYNEEEFRLLLNQNFNGDYRSLYPIRELTECLSIMSHRDLITKMCYADTKLYLPALNLTYPDKASAAAAVEMRPPLLDHKIVEYVFKLPYTLKIRNLTQKYIFKNAMKGRLPRQVINRPKAPFGAPLRSWIGRDLAPLIAELLGRKTIEKRDYLNYNYVSKIIEDNKSGKEDNAHRIWALLTLELWFRTFIDGDGSKAVTL